MYYARTPAAAGGGAFVCIFVMIASFYLFTSTRTAIYLRGIYIYMFYSTDERSSSGFGFGFLLSSSSELCMHALRRPVLLLLLVSSIFISDGSIT